MTKSQRRIDRANARAHFEEHALAAYTARVQALTEALSIVGRHGEVDSVTYSELYDLWAHTLDEGPADPPVVPLGAQF